VDTLTAPEPPPYVDPLAPLPPPLWRRAARVALRAAAVFCGAAALALLAALLTPGQEILGGRVREGLNAWPAWAMILMVLLLGGLAGLLEWLFRRIGEGAG